MGSVNLDSLKNTEKAETGHTYADLHLDVEETSVSTNLGSVRLQGKDIRADYDLDAIVNSLLNIFKTVPGERFLVPTFGSNLRSYLFSPVTQHVANQIGREILRAIELWEPRVTVDRIDVLGRPENHEYEITIALTIIELKERVTLDTTLDESVDLKIRNLSRSCPTT